MNNEIFGMYVTHVTVLFVWWLCCFSITIINEIKGSFLNFVHLAVTSAIYLQIWNSQEVLWSITWTQEIHENGDGEKVTIQGTVDRIIKFLLKV